VLVGAAIISLVIAEDSSKEDSDNRGNKCKNRRNEDTDPNQGRPVEIDALVIADAAQPKRDDESASCSGDRFAGLERRCRSAN
jgi:hypothetical protein